MTLRDFKAQNQLSFLKAITTAHGVYPEWIEFYSVMNKGREFIQGEIVRILFVLHPQDKMTWKVLNRHTLEEEV